jgi:hypothetical protein
MKKYLITSSLKKKKNGNKPNKRCESPLHLEKAIEDARRWKDSNVHGLAELILYK